MFVKNIKNKLEISNILVFDNFGYRSYKVLSSRLELEEVSHKHFFSERKNFPLKHLEFEDPTEQQFRNYQLKIETILTD